MTFEEIKQKYINTFDQKQKDLQNAWNSRDIVELHDLLHKLTGSSGSYGFDDLYSLCFRAAKLTKNEEKINVKEIDICLKKIYLALSFKG